MSEYFDQTEPTTARPIAKLAAALAKAQGQIEDATKDSLNPHFKSKYADLASVRSAIRMPLSENGLAYVQLVRTDDRGVIVETVLMHESGESIGDALRIPLQQMTAQTIGSGISYGRRYSLMSIIGLAADDDDGEAAIGRNNATASRQDSGTPRKSSAQMKREDVWKGLEADLADCGSTVALDKLERSYAETMKDWPVAWQTQGSEAIEKRRKELTEPVDDHISEADRVALEALKNAADEAQTAEELKAWAMEPKQQKEIGLLPPTLHDDFAAHYKAKIRSLGGGRSAKPYAGTSAMEPAE